MAIREYLEIDPRIKVLNERCRVFLDLAEILSDSVADTKMSAITWIIIVLIAVSILVTTTEVGLRFGMLERERNRVPPGMRAGAGAAGDVSWSRASLAGEVVAGGVPSRQPLGADADLGRSDLEELALAVGLRANASLDDVKRGIWDLRNGEAAGEAEQ